MGFSQRQIRQALRLYAVTDSQWLEGRSLTACVKSALAGGATFIQLREKALSEEKMILLARELKKVCEEAVVPFVINDNIDVARAVDADGIHLGQSDISCKKARELLGPDKIVGISVQSLQEALRAQSQGADYLGVGAMFGTQTKLDADRVSVETLVDICTEVSIPVVAIGGLNEQTIPQLEGTGVDGAAVVSSLFASSDIEKAARKLRYLIDRVVAKGVK